MEHLIKYKGAAKNRYDKGDYWWELRHCDYYPEFEREKVMWKRIGSILRFGYDNQGMFCQDSTVIMTGRCLKYLCAIMNSRIGHIQLFSSAPKTGTGDLIISVQALEPLLVPPITPENQQIVMRIEKLVDEIFFVKKYNSEADTFKLEQKIDQLVYKLYNLTPEEIKIVEGG
jgi:hypothetical protein